MNTGNLSVPKKKSKLILNLSFMLKTWILSVSKACCMRYRLPEIVPICLQYNIDMINIFKTEVSFWARCFQSKLLFIRCENELIGCGIEIITFWIVYFIRFSGLIAFKTQTMRLNRSKKHRKQQNKNQHER